MTPARRPPLLRAPRPRRWGAARVLVVGAALLAVAGFGLRQGATLADDPPAGYPPPLASGPRLTMNPHRLDVGLVKLGQSVPVVFDLSNAGDQPLRFTQAPSVEVVAGCCAPVPMIGARVLNPGEHTILWMEFTIRADPGGPHSYRVHLATNDPTQPDATLLVLGFWTP